MHFKICRLQLASLMAVLSLPAQAQVPGDSAPASRQAISLDEIIVTAERRAQRLQDTPVSVVALTGEDLDVRGITNLGVIGNYAPNVQFSRTGRAGAGGSAYGAWIRGVGNTDYTYPTDPGIGLYVDGVYIGRTLGGLLSLADIERIEVLRGPQGTLYGRNTLGGAIKVVTKAAPLSGSSAAKLLARWGSYGRKDLLASMDLPLIDDRLGVKLSAASFNSDGWGRRLLTGEDEIANERRLVFRAGLAARLTDELLLDIRADYSRQRNNGALQHMIPVQAGTPALITRFNTIAAPAENASSNLPPGSTFGPNWSLPGTYLTNSTGPLRDDFDIGGVVATLAWAPFANFELTSITAYRKLSTDIWIDGDGAPYSVSYTEEETDDEQFSQELQVSGTAFNDALRYLVGAYYFDASGDSTRLSLGYHGIYEITGLLSDARDTLNYQDFEATSYAFFTQEELKLGKGFSATVGARWNKDKKQYGLEVVRSQVPGSVIVPPSFRSTEWSSFTPKFGLNWQVNEDLLLYTSYARGFKSGGFSNPTAAMPAPVYGPEELETYEIGLRSQWYGRRLTANLTAFWSEWSEIQLTVIEPGPTGGVVSVTGNAGTAKVHGFEGEFLVRPTRQLGFSLSGSYLQNRFTELAGGVRDVTLATKLPRAPKWTMSAGAQYDIETAVGLFALRGDASYRSSQFMNIADMASLHGGHTLISARASFVPAANPRLEFAVEGKNLTDEFYNTLQMSAAPFWGVGFATPGEPREVFVTVSYTF